MGPVSPFLSCIGVLVEGLRLKGLGSPGLRVRKSQPLGSYSRLYALALSKTVLKLKQGSCDREFFGEASSLNPEEILSWDPKRFKKTARARHIQHKL